MDSPYDVLGIEADADDTEIERAYRRRVKEVHPDRGGSAAAFRRVREAYEAVVSGEATPPADTPSSSPQPKAGSPTTPTDGADDTGATDERGVTSDAHAGEDEGTPPRKSRVEYLNYEVLANRGWDIDDPDLFKMASAADLSPEDYGQFLAEAGETLLEAAENRGFAWPYACRGGACANCAVAVVDGELDASVDNILTDDLTDDGFRLSCIGHPITRDMRIVFNVKHLPGLEDLRLPADRFERARADD